MGDSSSFDTIVDKATSFDIFIDALKDTDTGPSAMNSQKRQRDESSMSKKWLYHSSKRAKLSTTERLLDTKTLVGFAGDLTASGKLNFGCVANKAFGLVGAKSQMPDLDARLKSARATLKLLLNNAKTANKKHLVAKGDSFVEFLDKNSLTYQKLGELVRNSEYHKIFYEIMLLADAYLKQVGSFLSIVSCINNNLFISQNELAVSGLGPLLLKHIPTLKAPTRSIPLSKRFLRLGKFPKNLFDLATGVLLVFIQTCSKPEREGSIVTMSLDQAKEIAAWTMANLNVTKTTTKFKFSVCVTDELTADMMSLYVNVMVPLASQQCKSTAKKTKFALLLENDARATETFTKLCKAQSDYERNVVGSERKWTPIAREFNALHSGFKVSATEFQRTFIASPLFVNCFRTASGGPINTTSSFTSPVFQHIAGRSFPSNDLRKLFEISVEDSSVCNALFTVSLSH